MTAEALGVEHLEALIEQKKSEFAQQQQLYEQQLRDQQLRDRHLQKVRHQERLIQTQYIDQHGHETALQKIFPSQCGSHYDYRGSNSQVATMVDHRQECLVYPTMVDHGQGFDYKPSGPVSPSSWPIIPSVSPAVQPPPSVQSVAAKDMAQLAAMEPSVLSPLLLRAALAPAETVAEIGRIGELDAAWQAEAAATAAAEEKAAKMQAQLDRVQKLLADGEQFEAESSPPPPPSQYGLSSQSSPQWAAGGRALTDTERKLAAAERACIEAGARADQAFAERARRRKSFVVSRLTELFPEAPRAQIAAAVESTGGELVPAYQALLEAAVVQASAGRGGPVEAELQELQRAFPELPHDD
eukprot:SAG31_NODE_5776_length_2332_cov_1.467532_1_plen_355_part_01